MLTQEDLQAIQTMLEKTITPITERLNRIEGRLENVEERLEKVEENTEITREATNYLLDLVEGKENAIKKLMQETQPPGKTPVAFFYFRAVESMRKSL